MYRSTAKLLAAFVCFFYLPATYYYGWLAVSNLPIDFPSYYYAAYLTFVAGRTPFGFNVFDMFSEVLNQKVNPYIYPPPSLLAFWPLAQFSLTTARTLFLIASHACYLGSVWLILTRLTPLPRERLLRDITLVIALIYMLCFDPAYASLGIGQINPIALFFICLTLAEVKRGAHGWRVALPLSIAILFKTYPVLLLLPLLFRRQFRSVALTTAYFAAFTAISVVVLPMDVWTTWWTAVVPSGGYANTLINAGLPWNQSLNGFVMRVLMDTPFSHSLFPYPWLARPLMTALALLILGVTVFFSYTLSRTSDPAIYGDDEMAAYLLMIFLIAPLSWDHHLLYILPAIILVIARLLSGAIRGALAGVFVVGACIMAWQIPLHHPAFRPGWLTLLISIKFYPVLALWFYFIYRMNRLRSLHASEVVPVHHAVLHNELDLA